MHDCPDCDMACDCDMEDHYQRAPSQCVHACDEDEFDDDEYDDDEELRFNAPEPRSGEHSNGS